MIDDGPGIDAGQLPYVFDRFHIGNSAGGSGLGLAIALQLAQRMEGTLEVASEPGRTVFTLSLPLAGPRADPRPRGSPAQSVHSAAGRDAMRRSRNAAARRPAVRLPLALARGCGTAARGVRERLVRPARARRAAGRDRTNTAGAGFDPAAIYRRLSPGVVTITSLFGNRRARTRCRAAPGRAAGS